MYTIPSDVVLWIKEHGEGAYIAKVMRDIMDNAAMSWVDASKALPVCDNEYRKGCSSVCVSAPCWVMTEEHRFMIAVYVIAKNPEVNTEEEGWTEKTGNEDDFSCLEKLMFRKTIKVLRWQYYKQQEKA